MSSVMIVESSNPLLAALSWPGPAASKGRCSVSLKPIPGSHHEWSKVRPDHIRLDYCLAPNVAPDNLEFSGSLSKD